MTVCPHPHSRSAQRQPEGRWFNVPPLVINTPSVPRRREGSWGGGGQMGRERRYEGGWEKWEELMMTKKQTKQQTKEEPAPVRQQPTHTDP